MVVRSRRKGEISPKIQRFSADLDSGAGKIWLRKRTADVYVFVKCSRESDLAGIEGGWKVVDLRGKCYENHGFRLLRTTLETFSGISGNASQILSSGVVMGRQTPFRKTADVLRKTIQQLEDDPTIDTQGSAFVDLKCNLLSRIIELETGKARAESIIHLVDFRDHGAPEAEAATEAEQGQDSSSAIA